MILLNSIDEGYEGLGLIMVLKMTWANNGHEMTWANNGPENDLG